MRFLILSLAALWIILPGSLSAQTIHKNDLHGFAGCFTPKLDSAGNIVQDDQRRAEVYTSSFCAWVIDVDRGRNRDRMDSAWTQFSPRDGYRWFIMDTAQQDWRIHYIRDWSTPATWYDKHRFYFMRDHNGNRFDVGCLTIWEDVGNDSLRYVCGHIGYGRCKLKRTAIFPDESFLVCLECGEGDVDFLTRWFVFLRSDSLCNFSQFYKREYTLAEHLAGGDELQISYDKVKGPHYRIPITQSFLTLENGYVGWENWRWRIDSAKVEVIDLWDKAKEFYDIDTTAIDLHYIPQYRPPRR